MTIQFNTGHNIAGTEALSAPFIALISKELNRFSTHISRIEVHLTDQDGDKDGQNDKRCMMEARLEGKQPIAVTYDANTHDQAVEGAIDKLKASLATILDRKSAGQEDRR